MDQTKYENVMFFMTVLNIVAGLVSISLATVAILALREVARDRRPIVTKPVTAVDVYAYHNETPTEAASRPVVRRSPMLSAQGRREFYG